MCGPGFEQDYLVCRGDYDSYLSLFVLSNLFVSATVANAVLPFSFSFYGAVSNLVGLLLPVNVIAYSYGILFIFLRPDVLGRFSVSL